MFELTIILKKDDATYKQKFLCYDEIGLNANDPMLNEYITRAKENCGFSPEEIRIKISMEL